MKLRFRATVMSILLPVIVVTVAIVGTSSYLTARSTAEDLLSQVLSQASLRIDQWIERLLGAASRQGELNRSLIESGQVQPDDFARLSAYWVQVMQVEPELTYLSLGLEKNGDYVHVTRTREGRLSIRELRRTPDGRLEMRDYYPEDYPKRSYQEERNKAEGDPRHRPYYKLARQAIAQVWTQTYVFLGVGGKPDVPGVTCATPVYHNGSLTGVLTSDFDLYALSSFLKTLHIGDTGFAFVVEQRADGTKRVIAHPQPELLLPKSAADPVEVDKISDARVQGLMAQLPGGSGLVSSVTGSATPAYFQVDGTRFVGAYQFLQGEHMPRWMICTVVPEADILGRVARNNVVTAVIGVVGVVFATLLIWGVSSQVARPLEQLAREAGEVGMLNLEAKPVPQSIVTEVDRMAMAMDEMKAGLRSFEKYVPSDLVRSLLTSGQEAVLGGEHRTLTIYFSDIRDFTTISEKMTPEEIVALLGEYLGAMSEEILKNGGTVDKYVGDAIMAFWGAPAPSQRHAMAACLAALHNRDRLASLREKWQQEGKPLLYARIGINTGEVVVGNIGSHSRLNYTAMGDAVNLASRLEGLNKEYGTEIMISEFTYHLVAAEVVARPLDYVSVKGRQEPVLVYEMLGLKGQVPTESERLAEAYERGLGRYRKRDWKGAIEAFLQVLEIRPKDHAAQIMLSRCLSYQADPPPESWDGVHHMLVK